MKIAAAALAGPACHWAAAGAQLGRSRPPSVRAAGGIMLHAESSSSIRRRCDGVGEVLPVRRTLVAALFLSLACTAADAQWLNQPTPGLPRTADGRPNLAAPAPRAADGHPDLTGLWQLGTEIGYAANITADLPPADIQPWATALSRQRLEEFGKDDPEITGCKPGGPRHITRGGLTKIIQTPVV